VLVGLLRRDNGAGIRNVCRRFVVLCRDLKLFSQAIVAIDSSKFKAVNSRDRNFTAGKIDKRQEQIEQSVQRYLDALETADRTQPVEIEARTERLQEKIKKLRQQMHQLDGIKERLKSERDEQLSLTDPDARSMISQAKGTGVVGYNVQTAVDAKHHLIVAHEVTKACEEAGITALVSKPMTSNAKAAGRFSKADFIYIARDDVYQCPAGQPLRRHQTTMDGGLRVHTYWTYICPHCPLKAQCTTGNERRVRRWEHEEVIEAMQRRLDRMPEAMTRRRSTIEHVFGTLKHWMGSAHFLTRTLANVSTEMSLQVLAYNLKRVMSILGIARTMKAMKLVSA